MAPRETENNAYPKFWGDKQRELWYLMVFSGVVNSLELVIPREKSKEYFFARKFPTEKHDCLFKIPLIPGNFIVERPENVCSINISTGISGIYISW